jgi:hypothetical protein
MKININEIKIKIKLMEDTKYPDVMAQAFLSFIDDSKRTMTFSGFTVRKSKFQGYYATPPSRGRFKFFLAEISLWKEIEREILNEYEKAGIPVIEE